MKNHHLAVSETGYNLADTSTAKESPFVFVEAEGLLKYKEGCQRPEFLNSSSVIKLFSETVTVDHFVLMFPHPETLTDYADALVSYGAQIIEGPGLWPYDFCPDMELFPKDLSMYFFSALMLSGGIIVLAAPQAPNDQIDRLLKERGTNAVHHVAIRVNNIYTAAKAWQKKGFIPLSRNPQDDGSLCQWFFHNWAGQIIELIRRKSENIKTFSCQNIAGLRLSEKVSVPA